MLFKCRVCEEKDKRIADLNNQIRFLRDQLVIDNSAENTPLPLLEADGILSAQQHVLDVPAFAENRQYEEERSERDRILSGTY